MSGVSGADAPGGVARGRWEIREGDCLESLRAMPDESVQTCVTSPPYWGLRDYGHGDQLGMEETPDLFVANMVKVFAEVRRVLRDDGTLWLNIGDSYAGSWGNQGRKSERGTQRPINGEMLSPVHDGRYPDAGSNTGKIPEGANFKAKDLVGIPWLLAFALRADGWYLRSEIIWAKPNPMPESVTDRPTKAHEQVFLLTKSPRYFYDADAVREEGAMVSGESRGGSLGRGPVSEPTNMVAGFNHSGAGFVGSGHRNKRTVWTVATQPFSGAHFATFPPKLIEPMILAGSPPKCCGVCSAPWQRVVERTRSGKVERAGMSAVTTLRNDAAAHEGRIGETSTKTVGWEPTCEHNDDTGSSVVLDPFSGSGTTGMVALRHDRSYIGLELNPEYAAMSRNRIRDDAPLLNTHLEAAA